MLLTISENDDIINYKSEIYSINEKHLIISESMIESLEFRNPLINFRGLEKINSHFLAKMTYIESPEFPIEKIIKIIKEGGDIKDKNYNYLYSLQTNF